MSSTSKITSSGCSACYIEELLAQGQDNLNICPLCFKAGERKKYCKNAVLLDESLVCCYFGNKHEICPSEFNAKVREMKQRFQ